MRRTAGTLTASGFDPIRIATALERSSTCLRASPAAAGKIVLDTFPGNALSDPTPFDAALLLTAFAKLFEFAGEERQAAIVRGVGHRAIIADGQCIRQLHLLGASPVPQV